MHRNRPFPRHIFGPSVHKLAQLLHALSLLVDSDLSANVAPVGLAAVLGVCRLRQCFCLHCYAFARRMPQTTPQTLPTRVQGELFLCLSLAPFWEVDLQRPWSPTIVATDAADACGFGTCAATANTNHVRRLGRLCVDHQAVAILNSNEVDAQTKTRSFRPVLFHLHKNKFRTVVSSRRRFSADSGHLEAIAGVRGLEWFLRKADNQSKRLLFQLDPRAVLGAFAKGRSSAPSLFRAVRRAAAIQLAGDLVVRWVHITSELNPADAPSRGLHSQRQGFSPQVHVTARQQNDINTTFRPRLA